MNIVSSMTLKNITRAWHKIIAMKVAVPKDNAFIVEPKSTRMKKSHINEAKQICKGEKTGFSSLPLYKAEKITRPAKINPEIEGTKILTMVSM